jgi:outer membrane protein assembly factor BamB
LFAITNNGSAASNKWTFFPGESLHGSATIGTDGTVYFGGGNANFYAVNPNGSQKWVLSLQAGYGTEVVYQSTPAIGRDGTIYFVAQGRLYAVTPSGTIKWKHDIDETNSTPARVLAPSIGSDGTIYAGGYYAPVLLAINPDGSESWAFTLGSAESPAIGGGGTLYITLGGLRAVAGTGVQVWETGLQASAPATVGGDGTIYVGNRDLALYSIAPNGQTNWQAVSSVPTVYGMLPTTPAVDAAGTIYYCISNALFAISRGGSVQWVFKSGYAMTGSDLFDTTSSPAIAPDGTIYCAFGSKLFAVAGTNALADSPWPMYHQNPRHTGKVEKPSLNKPQKRSDGGFQFQLYGQLSNSYTIQASTSLVSWSALTSLLVTNVPMNVLDLDATNFPSRFYRALSP